MSNSVFQSVIVQLRDITDRSFGVIDTEGCVVSCTDMSILGERWTDAALKVSGAADSIVTFGQRSFKAILAIPMCWNMPFSAPATTRLPAASARWPISP